MMVGSHSPAMRDMTRNQYLLFLLLPALLLALISGASKFGSARFDNRLMHFAFSFASVIPDWVMLELGSVLAAIALRPWRVPLWVLLMAGIVFASVAHAPLTLLRDPVFRPFLQAGTSLYPSWPWNFLDSNYAMESAIAFLGRVLCWLPLNYAVVNLMGFRRLGRSDFFHVGADMRAPHRAADVPAADADDRPSLTLLLRRLPQSIGREILCLQAQEHYTKVVTSHGSALVYMRFSDAVALAELGIEGVQIHRSYWVAYAAMAGFARVDGRTIARLVNGEALPISRTYQAQVRGLKTT